MLPMPSSNYLSFVSLLLSFYLCTNFIQNMSSGIPNSPQPHDLKPVAPLLTVAPPNFSPEEDYFLAKAVCRVSTDPLVGNDQKGPVYWDRVQQAFAAFIDDEADVKIDGQLRTAVSLKNHFQQHISKDVKEFNVILKDHPLLSGLSGEYEERHMQRASQASQ
jgi:hypothetical protein